MTDKLRAAAQAALEALENLHGAQLRSGLKVRTAPTAKQLRVALAEPETMTPTELADRIARGEKWTLAEPPVKDCLTPDPSITDRIDDHVALMNEDMRMRDAAQAVLAAWTGGVHPAMGAALRALRAALAEPDVPATNFGNMEPVAWMKDDGAITTDAYRASCWRDSRTVTPLYTAPPRREWQSLTDEEIADLSDNVRFWPRVAKLARIIEAALKEKNHD